MSGAGIEPFVVCPSGHWGAICAWVNPPNASRRHYEPHRHAWHPANKEPRDRLHYGVFDRCQYTHIEADE